MVRRVRGRAGQSDSATGTGGVRARAGMAPGAPGAEPTNWGSFFSGSTWEFDAATAGVLPAPVLGEAAGPQLGESRGAACDLRHDAMVARSRRRRVPHGRHQHDLQGHRACRTERRCDGGLLRRRLAVLSSAGRGFTSSCRRCTARSSPAGPDVLLTVGEMPGVTRRRCGAVHRSGPRARSTWCSNSSMSRWIPGRGGKWDIRPLRLLDLKASLGRWQAGLAETRLEQPLLGQPRPAARGLPIRRRRRIPGGIGETARHDPAPAPRNAVRVPGRRTGHDQRARSPAPADFRDIESVNHFAGGDGAGRGPGRGAGRAAATQPGQRAHTDAVGRRPDTPDSPPASRGLRSIRTTSQINAARPDRRPGFGVRALPRGDRPAAHAIRSSRTAISPCCCRTIPPVYAFTRSLPRQHPAGGRQLLRRPGAGGGARRGRRGPPPSWSSATIRQRPTGRPMGSTRPPAPSSCDRGRRGSTGGEPMRSDAGPARTIVG